MREQSIAWELLKDGLCRFVAISDFVNELEPFRALSVFVVQVRQSDGVEVSFVVGLKFDLP